MINGADAESSTQDLRRRILIYEFSVITGTLGWIKFGEYVEFIE